MQHRIDYRNKIDDEFANIFAKNIDITPLKVLTILFRIFMFMMLIAIKFCLPSMKWKKKERISERLN
jgi:hypothetical protein